MRATIPALLMVFSIAMPDWAAAQGRPARVATDVVVEAEASETISVFGEVVSGRESRVASRIAGIAVEAPIKVGERVSAGAALARIDTELLEIGLAEAEAAVEVAEAGIATVSARLDRAQKALRRAETLRANAAIAEAQLEDRLSDYAEAQGAYSEARARVDAARTALRRAQYNLKNSVIRAPFDAVVLAVATEIGQFVSAGSEIATLLDVGAIEVEANVPARFVDALQKEQPVFARTDAGGAITLRLRAALPTEFSSTRTRPVRFVALELPTSVAVGQSVTLDVPVSAPRRVSVVPKDALIQSPGGWRVFVALEGKAVPRPVEIGQALGDRFEVISGLAAGDVVVVRGNERLRPGQDIAPDPVGTDGKAVQEQRDGSVRAPQRGAQTKENRTPSNRPASSTNLAQAGDD